jgi:hypothetical protein
MELELQLNVNGGDMIRSLSKLWSLKKAVSDLRKTTEKGGRWRSGPYLSYSINDVEGISFNSAAVELQNIWWLMQNSLALRTTLPWP